MKKVLYVEDNRANRILIGRLLDSRYDLTFAEDGETGLRLAGEIKPDLILMDIGLPDFDGQTVGAMIRQIPELKDVRIVALTAWPEAAVSELVSRYNFNGSISKPIDVSTFPSLIESYLKDISP
ncbi:MAG: CheY-like chemotaxis protein [Cellvibrionaceae bacterium]|jgi:CheY-like chemotaxis protein